MPEEIKNHSYNLRNPFPALRANESNVDDASGFTCGENTNNTEKTTADRDNTGKPKYSLLNLECLEPCVRVLEYGTHKYSRDNWKLGQPVNNILDSLLRHIRDLQEGKTIDDESGLPIIGHIQCNAMFLGNKNNTKV